MTQFTWFSPNISPINIINSKSILKIKMLTCPNELVPDLDFLTSNNEVPFDFLEFIVLFFSSATQNQMLENLDCDV